MKRFWKEILILIIQVFLFYITPLFAGPTDTMGLVLLLIVGTFILSIIISSISKEKIKYFYPLIVGVLFTPSIFIYYNETALIHIVWYFAISLIGLVIGTIIYKLSNK